MALVLLEGFEDTSTLFSNTGVVLDPGRTIGTCLAVRGGGGGEGTIVIPTASQSATLLLGFALKISGGDNSFLVLKGDAGATNHNDLTYRSATGNIQVRRGGSTVLGTSAAASITSGAWHYIELAIVLHDTAGSVTLRINGTPQVTLTNQDTRNAGTAALYDRFQFAGSSTNPCSVDDLYVQTGTVTMWGDTLVETLYPNGNGAENTWVGSDGNSTDNYLLVDEAGTPSSADYVGSGTAGARDLYTLGNLAAGNGSIMGVCHVAHMGTDAGTGQAYIVNRTTSTNSLSAAQDLTTTYRACAASWESDPEGGAWSIAKVNGMQAGVQVI